MRYVRSFGIFLYDFIVGDSLVIGIGIPLVVLLAWPAIKLLPGSTLPEILLPAGIILVLVLSLRPIKAK